MRLFTALIDLSPLFALGKSPAFADLPLADRERAWDADAAEGRVRAWASEGDEVDWGKYGKAFFWHDTEDAERFGAYKLGFADVIDGTLTAVPRGIFAAAAAVQGARGGVDIPEADMPAVKRHIERYYAKMRREFEDDSMRAPWESETASSRLRFSSEGDGGPVTLRTPLLPEGAFENEWYGLMHWTPEKFQQMRENFQAGVLGFAPSLNFDHAGLNPFAGANPAAGWLMDLVIEPGVGLDAVWELTDLGRDAIGKRLYRYISAEIAEEYRNSQADAYANVVYGGALTNTPFHDTMRGLFSGQPVAACLSQAGGLSLWARKPAETTDEAASPAAGGGIMTKLMDLVRRLLGLPDETSEDEAVAALEAHAALTAAEAAAPLPAPLAAPDMVTLSAADYAAMKVLADMAQAESERAAKAAEQAEVAQAALAEKAAEAAVDAYIAAGKIAPAQREPALKLALDLPLLFEDLFKDAPPRLDLKPHGFVSPEAAVEAGDSFLGLVLDLQRAEGLDWQAATRRISQERPDLYDQYRRATRAQKGA